MENQFPPAALEDLYRSHASMVRRALRHLGLPEAALDDATQDVFVVLVRRFADFDRSRNLTNWLWGIARRVAADHRRAGTRRRRLHAEIPAPPQPATPESTAAKQDALAAVDRFLAALDADKCSVYWLAEIEGYTGPEIAARLGVNENTVYARLRAARKSVREAASRDRCGRGTRLLGIVPLRFSWLTPLATASIAAPLWTVAPVPARPADLTLAVADEAGTEPPRDLRTVRIPARAQSEKRFTKAPPPGQGTQRKESEMTHVFVTFLALGAPASDPANSNDQDADAAAYRGGEAFLRNYEFEEDEVDGDRLGPDGRILFQPVRGPMDSLLKVRGQFNSELIRMTNDI